MPKASAALVASAGGIPRAGVPLAEHLAGWVLAGPALVLMWLMLLGPALAVLALSFTDWTFGSPQLDWAGASYYPQLLADRVFWVSLQNTLVYVAFVDGAGVCFAFHPTVGLITRTLAALSIPTTDWLKNPSTALFALGTIGIWQAIGLNMALFLAGLKTIPRDLYEAAAVDGAWERFRRVTWPMLGPVTLFVVTITAVRSFQVFDTVAVLTDGGPNKATNVLLFQMYQEGFSFLRSAYAAAITVVFLSFVLLLTLLQVKLQERWTHYG